MTEALTMFLQADLLEKLSGDDARIEKIEGAAGTIAQELRTEPRRIIQAILAALDPDVPANEPVVARAAQALETEWRTVRSIYTSPPIGLYRAILFDACQRVADDKCAAIAWLTAADTLPLMRLGREEAAVGRMLEALSRRTEELALVFPQPPAEPDDAQMGGTPLDGYTGTEPRAVNRSELLLRVAAAVGPNYRGNKHLTTPNPHWTNEAGNWSYEFADRMHVILANELDDLARDLGSHTTIIEKFSDALNLQRRWISKVLLASETRKKYDELRLNVLWWSKAMYSRSLRRGYRELPSPLAAVAMALDLLDEMPKPTPASVVYLLAESVQQLQGAEPTQEYALADLLRTLRAERQRLPDEWSQRLRAPTREGRLSLRDLVFASLASNDGDPASYVMRTGLSGDVVLSLPAVAKALFRQEQAVQLAGDAQ